MGGRNEQATLISRNNNQSSERFVRAVKVKMINSQFTTNGYDIDEPEPGTIAVNEIDTNADTCCLGAKLTILQMTLRTTNVYTCDPS